MVDIPFRDEPLATICVPSYFTQSLLYRFDYMKFRFGHLYEDAYFYTYTCVLLLLLYMCPPTIVSS
jgi:hypothetical protein